MCRLATPASSLVVEYVGLLCCKVWGGSRLPFPASRASGSAGQDADPHCKVCEALFRREVHKGGPLIKDAARGGELLPLKKAKCRGDRLLQLGPHARPLGEVCHHVQEADHGFG